LSLYTYSESNLYIFLGPLLIKADFKTYLDNLSCALYKSIKTKVSFLLFLLYLSTTSCLTQNNASIVDFPGFLIFWYWHLTSYSLLNNLFSNLHTMTHQLYFSIVHTFLYVFMFVCLLALNIGTIRLFLLSFGIFPSINILLKRSFNHLLLTFLKIFHTSIGTPYGSITFLFHRLHFILTN
jgi:hypothetical protein